MAALSKDTMRSPKHRGAGGSRGRSRGFKNPRSCAYVPKVQNASPLCPGCLHPSLFTRLRSQK